MLHVKAEAILVNEMGAVLLAERPEGAGWAPPGGAVAPDELVPEGLARLVEESTGLKSLPVRLVSVYHRAETKRSLITFSLRCLLRGGTLQETADGGRVAYFASKALPTPMSRPVRERVLRGMAHSGGPPAWGGSRNWSLAHMVRRAIPRWRRAPRPVPPAGWRGAAFVILRDDAGKVLWVQRRDDGRWNLPGGGLEPGESPWAAAVREAREETGLHVRLTHLVGVYAKQADGILVFSFAGAITGGRLTSGPEAAAFRFDPPSTPPEQALPRHVERVRDARDLDAPTLFRAH